MAKESWPAACSLTVSPSGGISGRWSAKASSSLEAPATGAFVSRVDATLPDANTNLPVRLGIVVLGMHRSGTSAVTSILEALGAHVGDETELTGRSWENPLGFFERRDMRRISDTLLFGAGADWWKLASFSIEAVPAEVVEDVRPSIEGLVAHLERHSVWALKEPRLSVLLPIIAPFLPDHVQLVHVFRHPIEVARSLLRRNGIPVEAGLALWELYNAAALRAVEGRKRIFIDYNSLLSAPRATARALATELQLDRSHDINPAKAAGRVSADLYREHAAPADSALISGAQARLWDYLRSPSGAAPDVSPEALAVLAAFERSQPTAAARRPDERPQPPDVAGSPDAGSGKTETGATELAVSDGTVGEILRLHQLREQAWVGLVNRRDAALAQAETILQQGVARDRELAALKEDMRAAKAKVLADREARRRAKRDAAAVRRTLARLTGSRSWRWTAPVRRLLGGAPAPMAPPEPPAPIREKPAAKKARPSDLPPAPAIATFDLAAEMNGLPPIVRRGRRDIGRVAFVTAIAGNYDPVHDPGVVDLRADYFLFTDDPGSQSEVWKFRSFDFVHADPARTTRFVKTHPHLHFPDYDRVIWVDGNLRLNGLAEDFVSPADQDCHVIAWRHPVRDCVYREAEECIKREKDDPDVIEDHVASLNALGYPERFGLAETSVVAFRANTAETIAFCNDWWRLIDNGSRRDQLSFGPAMWLHPELSVGHFGPKGAEMRSDPRVGYTHHPSYRSLGELRRSRR